MQLLVNEVFRFQGRSLRVLHTADGVATCIDIDLDKKSFPFRIMYSQIEEAFFDETAMRIKDPFLLGLHGIKEEHIKVARNRYENIEPLLGEEGLFYKSERFKIIERYSKQTGIHKHNLYKWLILYWQRGMSLYALLPNYQHCGGKGKPRETSVKKGRTRKNAPGQAPVVTGDIKRIFRRVTDKYILTKKKYTLAYAARRAQSIFLQLNPNTPEEELPTYEQFRYFLNKEVSLADKAKKKSLFHEYKNDVRPIRGTATQSSLGPGSKFEIDATIADIYLVSERDPTLIIGRPTIYLLVDTFSRMIVGFYIGMEPASYVTAMRAVKSVLEDWRSLADKMGLTFEDNYFHQAGLPDRLHADRGELLGHQVNLLSTMHSITLEFSPPYHAVSKAIVERHFRSRQATFKGFVPGVVEHTTVKKRGGRDYRLDATLNLREFKQIIFSSIILHNNFHTIQKYDRSSDMPSDLPAIPMMLWKWGLQNRTGKLRQANLHDFSLALLPREKVSFDDRGVKLRGLYYTSQELFKSGWLHRGQNTKRPKNLEAAYDPADANRIYLIVNNTSMEIWVCDLAPHSREFRDCSFWEVFVILDARKKMDGKNNLQENKHTREYESFVETVVSKAEKRKKGLSLDSKNKRISSITRNKQEAIEQDRQQTLIEPPTRPIIEGAQVQPLPQAEYDDDLDIPDDYDFLFGEE